MWYNPAIFANPKPCDLEAAELKTVLQFLPPLTFFPRTGKNFSVDFFGVSTEIRVSVDNSHAWNYISNHEGLTVFC